MPYGPHTKIKYLKFSLSSKHVLEVNTASVLLLVQAH